MPRKLAHTLPDTPTVLDIATPNVLEALGVRQGSRRDALDTSIMPADLVRHALFAASNFSRRADRPLLKNAELLATSWMRVTVTGEQLGQREADIYTALLALAVAEGGYEVSVPRAVLFERLGLSHGSNVIAQFDEDLDRLQSVMVQLSVDLPSREYSGVSTPGREYSVRGSLLSSVKRVRKINAAGVRQLEALRITLNPEFSAVIAGPALFISSAERRALREDALAGWLYNYFRAKFDTNTFKLAELRELSGLAAMRTDRFNEALVRAVDSLAKLGYELALPRAGSRIDGKGSVRLQRPTETKPDMLAPDAVDAAKVSRSRSEAVPTAAEITRLEQRAVHLARVAKQKRATLAKKAGLRTV